MYYANGTAFFGEWKEGLKHGKGTFFSNNKYNGDKVEGVWEYGER